MSTRTDKPSDKPVVDRMQSFLGAEGPSPDEAQPLDGATLGRYRIGAELGRGGVGVVYRAHDPQLKRDVALKVLRDPAGGLDQMRRLYREAALAARLSHPSIIPIYDIGVAEERFDLPVHYVVMELIEGPTLHEALPDLGRDRRLELIEEVADAIGHAHQMGVIHRDLKPANVMIRPDGRALVTDFGMARAEASQSLLTRSGDVLGTAYYLSPEQAQGLTREVGARADVWSLGVLLYEMLTDTVPFDGESVLEIHDAIVAADPEPPSRVGEAVSAALDQVCLAALSADPAHRFADGKAFADALRACRAGGPVELPEAAGARDRTRRLGRYRIRRKLGEGAAGTVFLAHDPVLDREVAIKTLTGFRAGSKDAERFAREARLIAQLDHPNVVGVMQLEAEGERPYIVMEYVPGESFERWLGGSGADRSEGLTILARAADGVAALHQRGIVHRDLKPANILLDEDRTPKVADLGLAREDDCGASSTHGQVGTPGYMSPEQLRDEADRVGPHTDVHALGVILFRVLTGRLPFVGTPVELMRQGASAERPGPRDIDPSVAVALDRVCRRAISLDPAARYPDGGAFAAGLRAAVAASIEAPPSSLRRPAAAEPAARVRAPVWPWWLMGASLAVLVVTIFVFIMSSGSEDGPEAPDTSGGVVLPTPEQVDRPDPEPADPAGSPGPEPVPAVALVERYEVWFLASVHPHWRAREYEQARAALATRAVDPEWAEVSSRVTADLDRTRELSAFVAFAGARMPARGSTDPRVKGRMMRLLQEHFAGKRHEVRMGWMALFQYAEGNYRTAAAVLQRATRDRPDPLLTARIERARRAAGER